MERIIEANTRQPKLVMGDLRTQVGATQQGCERMQRMCDQFGQDVVVEAMQRILRASAAEFGEVIRALPNGTHKVEGFLDSDGVKVDEPIRLCVEVSLWPNGIMEFDFQRQRTAAAWADQSPTAAGRGVLFLCHHRLLDPTLKYGHGAHDVVRFKLPENSVVNASPPSPTSSYMPTCQRLVDLILEALGKFKPDRAIAHSGGTGGSLTIAWKGDGWESRGHQYEIFGSAYGASAMGRGASGLTVHISTTLWRRSRFSRPNIRSASRGSSWSAILAAPANFAAATAFAGNINCSSRQPSSTVPTVRSFAARGIAGGELTDCPAGSWSTPDGPKEVVMPASSMVELQAGKSFCSPASRRRRLRRMPNSAA